MNTETNYRDILKDKLSERCQKNSKYSLRAFARDLGLSPQRLSHVLSGRHGLSPQAAQQVAAALDLTEQEATYFCTLVQEKHARSSVLKSKAKEKLQEITSQYKDLSLDHFKIIADWYHFAIMELTLVEGFSSEPKWIAKALGITEMEAKMALERLVRMELLELATNGDIRLTGQFFVDPKGTPSQALRQFHRQLMEKATLSMEFQKLDQREFSSTVLAIDESDLPKAKEVLKNFRVQFDKEFSAGKRKTKVYCLGIQFFSLQSNT
jgi:uncharacterized protein (TIGR02147 family)